MRAESFVSPTVGAYLATVTVPAAGLLTLATGGTLPGVVTLVGAWLAVAVVVGLVARSVSGLADVVGTVETGGAATLAPLAFFPTVLSAPAVSLRWTLAVAGFGSALLGLLSAILGWTVQNRRRRAAATEWYSVTAGDGDDYPTWMWLAAVTVPAGLFAVVGFALGEFDGELPTTLLTTLGSLGAFGSLIGDDETSLAVTDEGVVTNGWLRGVETITGYELDDEELRLQRGGLSSTVSVDCAELDDDERARLRAALDRLLGDSTTRQTQHVDSTETTGNAEFTNERENGRERGNERERENGRERKNERERESGRT